MDVHFIRDKVVRGVLDIRYVSSCDQTAYCFTEALPQTQVKYFREILGLTR